MNGDNDFLDELQSAMNTPQRPAAPLAAAADEPADAATMEFWGGFEDLGSQQQLDFAEAAGLPPVGDGSYAN